MRINPLSVNNLLVDVWLSTAAGLLWICVYLDDHIILFLIYLSVTLCAMKNFSAHKRKEYLRETRITNSLGRS